MPAFRNLLRFFWPVYLNAMPQDPKIWLVNDHNLTCRL
jgi:hypothetical protein